jgi:hypothetical protein
MKRFVRAISRRVSALTGKGLKSAQALGRSEFLKLFDSAIRGGQSAAVGDAESALIRHFGERTKSDWPDLPTTITDLRLDLSAMSDSHPVSDLRFVQTT